WEMQTGSILDAWHNKKSRKRSFLKEVLEKATTFLIMVHKDYQQCWYSKIDFQLVISCPANYNSLTIPSKALKIFSSYEVL
ncbi:putative late embryogenesis abundant protein 1-like, partial [Triplophysa rosa]